MSNNKLILLSDFLPLDFPPLKTGDLVRFSLVDESGKTTLSDSGYAVVDGSNLIRVTDLKPREIDTPDDTI